MIKQTGRLGQWLLMLVLVGVCYPLSSRETGPAAEGALYIIVNNDNSIDTISASELSRVFSKKIKTFKNGISALPVSQKSTKQVAKIFNKTILKKNKKQLKYYWSRKMFSGSSKPPKKLSSDRDVIKFVSSLKNAIGYVSMEPDDKNVKVIEITD